MGSSSGGGGRGDWKDPAPLAAVEGRIEKSGGCSILHHGGNGVVVCVQPWSPAEAGKRLCPFPSASITCPQLTHVLVAWSDGATAGEARLGCGMVGWAQALLWKPRKIGCGLCVEGDPQPEATEMGCSCGMEQGTWPVYAVAGVYPSVQAWYLLLGRGKVSIQLRPYVVGWRLPHSTPEVAASQPVGVKGQLASLP